MSLPLFRNTLVSSLLASIIKQGRSRLGYRQSSNYAEFRKVLGESKKVAVITGAGVSAESGVPTFRGSSGLWRKYPPEQLASSDTFLWNPSLAWEFYHYLRGGMLKSQPNNAHKALAKLEKDFDQSGRSVTVVTQNIDELHTRAGSSKVLELHGSLFRLRCTRCKDITSNYDDPICPSLEGRGAPDMNANVDTIPIDQLPSCKKCSGLLRPDIVLFGEMLNFDVLEKTRELIYSCDLCLVVGTSSIVYPAAMFAPEAASNGAVVAEFNLEDTPVTDQFQFHFKGPCGETLPKAFGIEDFFS